MNPSRWQKIDRLLDAAMDRPPSERAAFLLEACEGDNDLRHEVESLLDAHDRSGTFIEQSPSSSMAAELLGESGERDPQRMIGRTLGHYQLRSMLGAGGMGEVYAAKDLNLGREVAVKVLPPHLAAHPEALSRFRREAMAVAALSHPNILAIHDFGTETGVTYAVMELLKGETLRDRIIRSPLPWREAVDICLAIADGLSSTHAKGIIHRDIKPENIFLTESGGVKILDFGIARVVSGDSYQRETLLNDQIQTTRPGTLMGTIGYMSPEQVRGEIADAPSDIFSLGCMLAEMLTGKKPFLRSTAAETMAAILRDELPELSLTEKAAPADLDRVIRKCLRKNPAERYQSAEDLAIDLKDLISNTATIMHQLPQPGQRAEARISSRKPAWIVAIIALVVALSLAGLAAWRYFSTPADITSIAVMPFVNADADPEIEYLCDGVTEQVIGALSQVPKMRVLAKSTVARYKDKPLDPLTIGRELRVMAVLMGNLRRAGNDMAVSAELVNVADGSLLWKDQYLIPLTDVASTQSVIIRAISSRLGLTSTSDQQQRLDRNSSRNSESYQLYLKGVYFIQQESEEDGMKGVKLLEDAIRQDPTNAMAYAGLAQGYFNLSNVYMPPAVAMPKARAAAGKALELDSTLADAHAILAVVKSHYDYDWIAAETSYRRALELNPNNAFAHNMYGYFLTAMGRTEEAIVEYRISAELDPLSPSTTVAWPYYFAPSPKRRFDKAAHELRQLIRYNPDFPAAHGLLGLVLAEQKNYDESVKELRMALKIADSPWFLAGIGYVQGRSGKPDDADQTLTALKLREKDDHVQTLSFAYLYAGLDDSAQAIDWLEKAFESHEEEVILINVDPKFDRLRGDPRFQALVQKMRFGF
ncbi:MAG: protein kinase [Acidobacteria bacterium]|nr:protein kinase [Acidobacteriota bacterium]